MNGNSTKILIAGYYGFGNTGDEIILHTMLRDLQKHIPNLEPTVVSGNPGATQVSHGVQTVPWNNIELIVRAAEESQLVILGGGGLFHDYWGVEPDTILTRNHAGIAFYNTFPVLAAVLDKPLMLYAIGVGPLFSDAAKQQTRLAFELASIATVRDADSKNLLISLGLRSDRIVVAADPAFRLELVSESQVEEWLRTEGVALERPLVGVGLRDWPIGIPPEHWTREVAHALDRFVDHRGGTVVFVSFQREKWYSTDDRTIAYRVWSEMQHQHKAHVLHREYAPEQKAAILAGCDIVLGMRLHSIIFAAVAGVPVVGLSYDPKVVNAMRQLGCEANVVTLDSLSTDRLSMLLQTTYDSRREIKRQLAARATRLKALAEKSAELASQLLQGRVKVAGRPRLSKLALNTIKRMVVVQSVRVDAKERAADALQEQLTALQAGGAALQAQVTEQERILEASRQRNEELQVALAASQSESAAWRSWYETVVRSRSYRITGPLRHGYRWLRTSHMLLRKFGQTALQVARKRLIQTGRVILPARTKRWLKYFLRQPSFTLEPNPEQRILIYTKRPEIYGEFPGRVWIKEAERPPTRQPVSLVATVKNEGVDLRQWLESIQAQRRCPDEIVIVDGGSSDDTVDIIRAFGENHGLPIRVLSAPGSNVATGRNIAIRNANSQIVAITDAGCALDPDWLDLVTLPFDSQPETEFVAGFYEARAQSAFEKTVARFLVPPLSGVDPRTFGPSSRSLAVRKTLWEKIGGYPEYLTLAGEDTVFNVNAKKHAAMWAFVPDAVVHWQVPRTFARLFKTMYSWGRGDGEAKLYGSTYIKLAAVYGAVASLLVLTIPVTLFFAPLAPIPAMGALILWFALLHHYSAWRRSPTTWRDKLRTVGVLCTIHLGQVFGYYRGWRNRTNVHWRKALQIAKNFLILAGIPISDTGGGQRSAQLTLELLRRGFKVTYVNRFPSYETQPIHLRYAYPLLDCTDYNEFDCQEYLDAHELLLDRTHVIVEFPLREYAELAKRLRRHGASIVYDLLDDWDSSLGGTWYSREVEDELIASSDLLVATAWELKEKLERRAPARYPLLLPNAVDADLFDPARVNSPPPDLPKPRPIIGYVGSMYGEWFREDLVVKVAQQYPEASVIVIGDRRQRFADPPTNLHALGLKPHRQIPDYLAHFDVCLVPFDPVPLIQATSPLKVFEYLAMRKPVVAMKMRELEGLPNVHLARSDQDFVDSIARALRQPVDAEDRKIATFVEQNSWKARVNTLLAALESLQQQRRRPNPGNGMQSSTLNSREP